MKGAKLTVLVLSLLMAKPLLGQRKIEPVDARNHMGERATVCGYITNILHVPTVPSNFGYPPGTEVLVLGEPMPPSFQIVIGAKDLEKFDENTIGGASHACVTGTIERNARNGKAQIVVHDPAEVVFTRPKPHFNPAARCKSSERWDERLGRCVQWRAPYWSCPLA